MVIKCLFWLRIGLFLHFLKSVRKLFISKREVFSQEWNLANLTWKLCTFNDPTLLNANVFIRWKTAVKRQHERHSALGSEFLQNRVRHATKTLLQRKAEYQTSYLTQKVCPHRAKITCSPKRPLARNWMPIPFSCVSILVCVHAFEARPFLQMADRAEHRGAAYAYNIGRVGTVLFRIHSVRKTSMWFIRKVLNLSLTWWNGNRSTLHIRIMNSERYLFREAAHICRSRKDVAQLTVGAVCTRSNRFLPRKVGERVNWFEHHKALNGVFNTFW